MNFGRQFSLATNGKERSSTGKRMVKNIGKMSLFHQLQMLLVLSLTSWQ